MNKKEQIIQGFNYAKNILNSISITGVDNFQKIGIVYNNIDIFLNMIANNELSIVENSDIESDDSKKATSSGKIKN